MTTRERIAEYITSYTQEFGTFPSYDTIRQGCALKSKYSIYLHIKRLKAVGFLEVVTDWEGNQVLRVSR